MAMFLQVGGFLPANRKPPGQRQDNRKGRNLAVVGSAGEVADPVLEPRKRWLAQTVRAWRDFWGSEVAEAVTPESRPAVFRLFDFRDEQERVLRLYQKVPMVKGSTGQPVVNPALTEVHKLEKSIVALEDRLGLTPKSRANLGIAIGQQQLTAAELNRLVAEDADDGSDVDAIEAEWEEAE